MAKRFVPGPPERGHCVMEKKIGNTRIRICDDYVVKTQEEIDQILQRCAVIACRIYRNKAINADNANNAGD